MRAIHCGTLIDGIADEPLRDATVLLDGEHVAACGPREDVTVPGDAVAVEYAEETVIPGLVDAHVHLGGWRSLEWFDWLVEDPALGAARATVDLERLLAAGFTSVRELGSRTGLGLRDAVAEGSIRGPRVFAAGLGVSQTGGFSDPDYLPHDWAMAEGNGISTLADGPRECRLEARKRIRQGADVVKIWTTGSVSSTDAPAERPEFTDAEIRAFTEEAHRAGIPVASHAMGAAGVENALANGVDTIEHGLYMDETCRRRCIETGGVLVPTLAYSHQFAAHGEAHGVSPESVALNERVHEAGVENARAAYEAGVPVALGTDFCGQEIIPHGENALEAELYVTEVGMTEMDAIKAATSVAARTIPADDVGTITEGMRADLVVLDGDPLADVTALRDVACVYKDGERVAG